MKSEYVLALNSHYGASDLISRIWSALEEAGVDLNALTIDSLGPMEEIHIAGRMATLELARLSEVNPQTHVLDVGCGIGGPARALAHHFGCKVTGIDLTEEFCRAAEAITQKMGMAEKVAFRHANALDLPFPEKTFDLVWMQHASMNIEDKPALFREIARVLKPDGKIALYEVLAGRNPIQYFPVPWAGDASLCFLSDEAKMKEDLNFSGFQSVLWEDITPEIRILQTRMIERILSKGWPPLNPGILLGPRFQDMAVNLMKNFEEDCLKVIRTVLHLNSRS